MQNAQLYGILSILAVVGLAVFYYPTDARVTKKILDGYSQQMETLSGNIQKDRTERKRLMEEWKKQDESLSGKIVNQKIEYERLKICLSAKSIDCANGKKESMLSLIPSAFAEVAHSERIGEPERPEMECSIGTGSHDIRKLARHYPGIAGWKNNNVSGITLGSKQLEKDFDDSGILWYVGTARPAHEGSNYYGFPDLENGMRAKLLIIKRSYKNASIASYLTTWGTDSINTHLDTKRTIASLSNNELLLLVRKQIIKESGPSLSNYIFENVITCSP